jgi:hypothetical protein
MSNDTSRPSLGNLLVERGVISPKQLDAALALQRQQGGMLGEILTSRGWVTPLSIAAAVAKQKAEAAAATPVDETPARGANWKPLGTLLVEKRMISDVQLKQALALQNEEGGFLGEILVDRGWLTAADLVLALAAQLGLDFDVNRAAGPPDAAAILPSVRPEAHFEVLEDTGTEVELLKTTDTFMEATDFVFDEVLWQWSFKPGEASPQQDSVLSVFGYSPGTWHDNYASHGDVAATV